MEISFLKRYTKFPIGLVGGRRVKRALSNSLLKSYIKLFLRYVRYRPDRGAFTGVCSAFPTGSNPGSVNFGPD